MSRTPEEIKKDMEAVEGLLETVKEDKLDTITRDYNTPAAKLLLQQPKRKDTTTNQFLISQAHLRLIKEFKRNPTIPEIARESGLCEKTVWTHLQNLDFSDVKNAIRTATPDVLQVCMEKAMNGSVADRKLFLQYFEKFSEVANKTELTTNVNLGLGTIKIGGSNVEFE